MSKRKEFKELTKHIHEVMQAVDPESPCFEILTTEWAQQLARCIAPHYVVVSEALFVGNWTIMDYHNDPKGAMQYARGLLEHAYEVQS